MDVLILAYLYLANLFYAYLIIIDSITLLASSHLSVTISITWYISLFLITSLASGSVANNFSILISKISSAWFSILLIFTSASVMLRIFFMSRSSLTATLIW